METMQNMQQITIKRSDYYEVVFHNASRQSVDEWFAFAEGVQKEFGDNYWLRFLVDYSESGWPPMRHFQRGRREFVKKYPDYIGAYLAIIVPDTLFNSLMTDLFRFSRDRATWAFFKPDQREQAISWLMQYKEGPRTDASA